jgi:hypothetical protein
MTEVNQYKIYCTTDSKWEYMWGVTPPTTCPTNTAHSVDLSSVSVAYVVEEKTVVIQEEETPTGGHFAAETIVIDAGNFETKVQDLSWPIPINVLEIIVHPTSGMENDTISVDIAPNTTVGVLTATGATGTTQHYVSSTVTDNIKVGYHCCLAGHTGAMAMLGRVLEVNSASGYISTEFAISGPHDFAPALTAVQQDIFMMYEHELPVSAVPFPVGGSKIGSSYIPANTTIRCTYKNSSTGSKHFVATVEYLY